MGNPGNVAQIFRGDYIFERLGGSERSIDRSGSSVHERPRHIAFDKRQRVTSFVNRSITAQLSEGYRFRVEVLSRLPRERAG